MPKTELLSFFCEGHIISGNGNLYNKILIFRELPER